MTSIEVKARVGADGVLTLNVPIGLAEADREVCVTVRPAAPTSPHDRVSWKRFIDETAGAWSGEPLAKAEIASERTEIANRLSGEVPK